MLIDKQPHDSRAEGSASLGRTQKLSFRSHAAWCAAVLLICFCVLVAYLLPAKAHAGIFSDLWTLFEGTAEASTPTTVSTQTMPLTRPAMNHDPNPAKGGGTILVEDGALYPQDGPGGTDVAKAQSTSISIYVVREGDTLSEIASMFGVSVNTIKWANDIPPSGTIRVGQVLTILPIDGLPYTVKSGDTLQSIAKKFNGDADEIVNFNGLEGSLTVGEDIIIPNGEMAAPAPKPVIRVTSAPSTGAEYVGYYTRPVFGAVRTQGIHGYNGVDLAAPAGTPVLSSAAGQVIIAREGGWNGGYGSYIVIKHDNGTQTLYAHLSAVHVGIGQTVSQGETIGAVGNSGRSTGAHLHFEIRGGPRNPF